MPKQLILLRHGKSSWKDSTLADSDRPLAKRGRRDAPRAGAAIAEAGLEADRVLSSPALRALETARAVVAAWDGDETEIVVEEELYHQGTDGILRLLGRQPDDADRVLLVGHNPELEDVLEALTGRWEALPTAAWALIDLQVGSWQALEQCAESGYAARHRMAPGRLASLWRPREAP